MSPARLRGPAWAARWPRRGSISTSIPSLSRRSGFHRINSEIQKVPKAKTGPKAITSPRSEIIGRMALEVKEDQRSNPESAEGSWWAEAGPNSQASEIGARPHGPGGQRGPALQSRKCRRRPQPDRGAVRRGVKQFRHRAKLFPAAWPWRSKRTGAQSSRTRRSNLGPAEDHGGPPTGRRQGCHETLHSPRAKRAGHKETAGRL